MTYAVETMWKHGNEWSNEFEDFADAVELASFMSNLKGVSETRIWYGDELESIWVDGECVGNNYELLEDHTDYYDEVGYNPYMGGYDWDC